MLGPALLIAPVVEPGARTRALRLPPGRWLELATGRVHRGDTEIVARALLGVPAWFVRQGHAVPVARSEHEASGAAVPTSDLVRGGTPWGEGGGVHWLGLPDGDGRLRGRLAWDDGVTRGHERGEVDAFELELDGDAARVEVRAGASGMGTPVMDLWTPAGGDTDPPDARVETTVPPWGTRWRARRSRSALTSTCHRAAESRRWRSAWAAQPPGRSTQRRSRNARTSASTISWLFAPS